VLSLPSGNTPVTGATGVTFIDEFRMMVWVPRGTLDVPEFTLFDTLVPRGHQVNSRRFRVPLGYDNCSPTVFPDGDQCFGTPDLGRPLTTDPTQAVFVVKLATPRGARALLIVRIHTLIEYVRSTSADACVPWDEWGRGAAVMDISQHYGASDGPYPLVHGARMIVVKKSTIRGIDGHHHNLYAFDFSQRSWSTLPLRDGGDGVERRVAFNHGRNLMLRGDDEMSERGFDSLGNGRFMYLVSPCYCWRALVH